jgi:hypothetical protein
MIIYYIPQFINIITDIYDFCLFTLTFDGRVPVSPFIAYTIKFVQRGFTEGVERNPHAGRGLAAGQYQSHRMLTVAIRTSGGKTHRRMEGTFSLTFIFT